MYGTEQRTYIKVGAIALIAVILLLAGITIGRGLNISTATAEVRIRAATAAGLEPGAPVWINGIKRGSVLRVRPEGDSVLIIVGLDDTSMLRRDARAQIAMLEITGGKRVDIFPGKSPARWEGQALPADAPADIAEVLSGASALATPGKYRARPARYDHSRNERADRRSERASASTPDARPCSVAEQPARFIARNDTCNNRSDHR